MSEHSLITGVAGFAGPFLARALAGTGREVVGLCQTASDEVRAALPGVRLFEADICDSERLEQVLAEIRPGTIYHLAGKSHVGGSWARQQLYYQVNALGTVALLQAASRAVPEARIVHASTGEVYGQTGAEAPPIDESHALRPQSPYAASKLCAEVVVRQMADAAPLHVASVRPFNFAGPGQRSTFVTGDFASQVARVEAGLAQPVISVGNLDVVRDFTDVRDIARGFIACADRSEPGAAYNLCSGRPVTIRSVLETLVGMATCPIEVRVDRARFRPADVPRFVGDATRAATELGWEPEIALDRTLADTLEFWRQQTRKGREG